MLVRVCWIVSNERLEFPMIISWFLGTYKKGVGAPVLSGSLGAMVFGSKGSGGGMMSFVTTKLSSL